MTFKAKDYSHLYGMSGFSKKLLENHFKLYEGYVENTNKLREALSHVQRDPKVPEFAELKRRFGWEFDGMRLHEFYFDNLGGKEALKKSGLQKGLEKEFGSFLAWEQDFRATAAIRGIGWAALCLDQSGNFFNIWLEEHDGGHLAGSSILLILDAFEHAYMIDYGIKRDEYIDAFLRNVKWELVAERHDVAQHTSQLFSAVAE